MIQVYTGNGKGKTTAAMGLAFRAWGQGLSVGIFQFLKSGGRTGEFMAAHRLGMLFQQYGSGRWIVHRRPEAEEVRLAQAGLEAANEAVKSGTDVVVLDEISHAVNLGLLPLDQVLTLLQNSQEGTELVLTGRDMPQAIVDCADLVTEMKEIKHPFRQGVDARQGIEY